MDEGTLFEEEDLFAGVAIGLVLMFGVLHRLRCELILELGGGDGDAADAENEIERLMMPGAVMKLAGNGEAVGVVILFRVGIHSVGGTEESESEILAEEIDSVTEDIERAAGIHGAAGFFEEDGIGGFAVIVRDDLPLGGLCFTDEGKDTVGSRARAQSKFLGSAST